MKKWISLTFLLLFAFACNQNKEKQINQFALKSIPSKGIWQNPDSFAKPISIPAGKPIAIAAGKPKINPTNLNVHIAGQPKNIVAGQPKVIIPGTDTFLLPKTVAAIGKVKPAGLPEIVIAKDMATKDQNPANFSFFKVLQGLKHNNIRCMLQDKTGNLWFGTEGGICRYDGKSFTNFTDKEGLANNVVLSILEDKTGNLWFGTNGGVCRYDGKSFTNFTDKEGLANNFVLSILEDKTGNLWFGTVGGVCRYDGNCVDDIINGTNLYQHTQQDLKKNKKDLVKSFTNFTDKEGLANNHVWSILEDKTGNLWFGTNGGGVCRYDGNRVEAIERGENIPQRDQQDLKKTNNKLVKSFTNFTDKEGLANNFVFSILEDKTGNLWFGTYDGVCRYDGNRVEAIERGDKEAQRTQQDLKKINNKLVKSFTNFTDKEGLANNFVFSILEDKTGNLWFGTYDEGGLSRYDGNCVDDLINGTNLYQHTQQDLKKNKKDLVKSFVNFTEKEGLANNVVLSILEDKTGNLWFGTNGGVCRYDGKSFTNFTDKEGLANNFVNSILEDKTGNLWFGTNGGGVCRYDGKSFTNFTDKEGLANNHVWSILEDKTGNLWFGTNGGGVCRYDGNCVDDIINGTNLYQHNQQDLKKNKKDLVKSFTNFTDKEGLANNVVNSILEDKTGNLWFGTYGGGVSRYDGNCVDDLINGTNLYQHTQQDLKKNKKDLVKSFTNFTDKEGLANNFVLSILEDKTGNLWFGTTGGGVSRYDGNCVDDIINGTNLYQHTQQDLKKNKKDLVKSFTNFTDKEGLANNAVLNLLQDKQGNIWFGTRKGLSRINKKQLSKLGFDSAQPASSALGLKFLTCSGVNLAISPDKSATRFKK